MVRTFSRVLVGKFLCSQSLPFNHSPAVHLIINLQKKHLYSVAAFFNFSSTTYLCIGIMRCDSLLFSNDSFS